MPPLHGHTNPTVAVGTELQRNGHQVAWCGYRPMLEQLLLPGAEIYPVGEEVPDELVHSVQQRGEGLRGAAALKFFWEDFLVPLGQGMLPGIHSAVYRFSPDVMIVDQQTVGGAMVALERGLKWSTSATTSAELVDPFCDYPMLKEWSDNCLIDLQVANGVPESLATAERLRFSEHLVIAFSTTALVGEDREFPDHWKFVGPAFGSRPAVQAPFDWSWLDSSVPAVLVSLGTVNAKIGERFYKTAVEALADQKLQTVIAAPQELVGTVPSSILVSERVPQVDLLPHMSAVVSHVGHNTVCETLANAIPLVLAPIRDDQPVIAAQVVAAGAGVRVKFSRVRPAELRDAVQQVMTVRSFGDSAAKIQRSFNAAGGAAKAAEHLQSLANQ